MRFQFLLLAIFFPLCASAQVQPPQDLPPLDSLDLSEMRIVSFHLFDLANALSVIIQDREELAERMLDTAQVRFEAARLDSSNTKLTLDSLETLSKTARSTLKKSSSLRAKAQKVWDLTGAMTDMDSLSLRKNLSKGWKQTRQLYDEVFPPLAAKSVEEISSGETEAPPANERSKRKQKPQSSKPAETTPSPSLPPLPTPAPQKKFATYSPANDVMLRPPTPPCVVVATSRDEFSGEVSQQMASAEIFRYTNPALKNYLQGKTHVVCEAALGRAGEQFSLQLTFVIRDPNARKAFGRLDKNSAATLKFMDGSTFTLQNTQESDGSYDAENDATVYLGQYAIQSDVAKKLRRTELDKIRIAWSKGYDDYEVQQVDLLMRQAECLSK